MTGRPRMAMSSDFLDAYARLPRAQQRGVRSLISRFNADPTASGLSYERIRAARDPAMRSLRIDQGYRAIALKPERGGVHMLLWADRHDDACAWAARHECRIHPETGALQVYAPRTDLPAHGARGQESEGGGPPGRRDGPNAAAFGQSADTPGTPPGAPRLPADVPAAPSAIQGAPADIAGRPPAAPGQRPGGPVHAPGPAPEPSAAMPGSPTDGADGAAAPDVPPPAFRALKDRELARLGVPPAMLAEVRAVRGEADLDAMQARLPVEACEALFLYLAGETCERLILEREAPAEPVDTEDFAKALERDESRARFVVVEDEMELEAMLNAPLERWRVFLHPSQRRLVERRWNGPVRVLGGAGTGKTVVAMHRARRLARNLLAPRVRSGPGAADAAGASEPSCAPGFRNAPEASDTRSAPGARDTAALSEAPATRGAPGGAPDTPAAPETRNPRSTPEPAGRILFTTFTRNLAADIEHDLRAICTPEEMECIEVTNLDRWVVCFLRRRRYRFRIVYDRRRDAGEAWQRALDSKPPDLDLPDAFYDDEWEQVVQANGVTTRDEYLRAPRTGRGVRLGRGARARVWPVFEEYRVQLAERGLKEVDDACRDAAALLTAERERERARDRDRGQGEGRSAPDYAAVVVDEAQDMGAPAWRLIRAIAPEGPDDLFITGDGHQRIHGRSRVVLGRCGIDVRGRARKLRLNYRTTEQTRRWAARLLAGRAIDDLDGGADDGRDVRSLTEGPAPILKRFASRKEQAKYVSGYLEGLRDGGEPLRGVCIVARTGRERDAIAAELAEEGLNSVTLEAGAIDDADAEDVRLATMHRVKGLEFDRVVIASMNDGLVPLPAALEERGDAVERESAETGERALVHVAATRAKREVLVLGFGRPSRFLSEPAA